jgi:RecB family exonuclease
VPGIGCPATLAGRIDRLDLGAGKALVVDYKAGKPTPYGKENRGGKLVAAGERLQLPAYALAARLFGATSVASEYLFVEEAAGGEAKVTPRRFDESGTDAAVEALGKVLALLDEAVRAGLFFPKTKSLRSSDPCRFCDFARICGPGHRRLYERKWAGEVRRDAPNPLARLREIP